MDVDDEDDEIDDDEVDDDTRLPDTRPGPAANGDRRLPVTQSGPAADSRRDARLIKKRLCLGFNICPICWMPLAVDTNQPIDKRWENVSVSFKGKPAFSIKHPSVSRSLARHTFAFGIMGIAPGKRNYEKCHYVHYSMVGNVDGINSYWTLYTVHDVAGLVRLIGPTDLSDEIATFRAVLPQTVRANADFIAFNSKVCVDDGVFKLACGRTSRINILINSFTLNHAGIQGVVSLVKTKFFVGCRDCNSCMTFINETRNLFRMIFFPALDVSIHERKVNTLINTAFNTISTETAVHYIMLSGIIFRDEHVNDRLNNTFEIISAQERKTWQLRYVLVWCALQILMSLWKFYGMDKKIGHHKSYVYIAVADFYFSLLFFVLHEASRPTLQTGEDIQFEQFNFFYASHVPFFMRAQESNLAMAVLQMDAACHRFEAPNVRERDAGVAIVTRQLGQILDASAAFWNDHFQHVSVFVSRRTDVAVRPDVSGFFIPPGDIVTRYDSLLKTRLAPSVQLFAEKMNPVWYWYHFKHITMPRIAHLCKQYDLAVQPLSMQGMRLWRRWYRVFDASVRALGVKDERVSIRGLVLQARLCA